MSKPPYVGVALAIAAIANLTALDVLQHNLKQGDVKKPDTFNFIRLTNTASTVSATATLQDMVIGLERRVISPTAAPLAERGDDKPSP